MPSFEELGINLEGLLSKYNNSSTLATNGVNGVYNTAGLDADNANNVNASTTTNTTEETEVSKDVSVVETSSISEETVLTE